MAGAQRRKAPSDPAAGGRVHAVRSTIDGDERPRRRDSVTNQGRILDAAAAAVRREGLAVPIATIAADAGVGVGTLYRHSANREVLLAALAERSYRIVHEHAQDAAAADGPAITAIEAFLAATIRRRDDLILPLHGRTRHPRPTGGLAAIGDQPAPRGGPAPSTP